VIAESLDEFRYVFLQNGLRSHAFPQFTAVLALRRNGGAARFLRTARLVAAAILNGFSIDFSSKMQVFCVCADLTRGLSGRSGTVLAFPYTR
jgi:hypothetical protein